ncbi:hypothetical protein Cri9333_4936 (plasmid) [Crinalium epipsammum PCC 9333]|uniref:Uncharacterized protein n=1 Tax=Crinalium epipsammum PCC 9333 TaxID=1173022 RepID=K9W7H3_9CYAN|nr:hypothetical protein [Crinalium epipsammum]AFZ15692.1 hypothetical protein Cri9333_4936 [Crinalium epipsammum PCC 9333]
MPNFESFELKLRIKRSKQQAEGKLLDYLLHHPTISSTEAVLSACRAYWMPLAMIKAGEENPAVLREVGWSAILDLEKQIQLIKRVLQLEETTSIPASSVPVVPVESVEAIAYPTVTTEQLPTPEDLDDELGVNDFD